MSVEQRPTDGSIRVAADIGGTFTDLVVVDANGVIETVKVLSSPPEFGRAVVSGLQQALEHRGWRAASVSAVFHGMTVATNAVIERRGARTALVTTKGFRDALEIATGRRSEIYNLRWEKPKPLVPRWLRYEVDQRITSRGELDPPVADADLDALADQIRRAEVESVAVCLINSHLRPDEEQTLIARLRERCPDVMFTASTDLTPEPGEFERTSTAVVNAYVQPVVGKYLAELERELDALGVSSPFYVMQSSGGLSNMEAARAKPVQLIESGPAAGVVATRALGGRVQSRNLIAFDMGGTTAKASLIEEGEAFPAEFYEVGGGINSDRGYTSGSGFPIRVPSLDIAEIGAGGGSVFWVDPGGSPRVGPHSAGARPGPACYGLGGTEPTLSDACVVLGYFNPTAIAGGAQPINTKLAEEAIAAVAKKLGLDVVAAAHGAMRIATQNMTNLVRAITTHRGRDPRDYTLVAFGGSGPAYAVEIARALEIRSVMVPPAPGLWSAVGLLVSDPQHDVIQFMTDHKLDPVAINSALGELVSGTIERLKSEGYPESEIEVQRYLDMRYQGQKGTLRISILAGEFGQSQLDSALDRLDADHRRTYGHGKARSTAEVVKLKIRAICRGPRPDIVATLGHVGAASGGGAARSRHAYFPSESGRLLAPVIRRFDLEASDRPGPLIVEEMDSTTVVPPGARARLDELGNILISVSG